MILNWLRKFRKPMKLEDFKEIRTVTDDNWNKIKNGNINLEYFDKNNNSIGYIDYRVNVGQIGLFFITNHSYINRGLGKQILEKAIKEIKLYKVKEVWAVTTDNHPFWSNVWNKSFKPKILHTNLLRHLVM